MKKFIFISTFCFGLVCANAQTTGAKPAPTVKPAPAAQASVNLAYKFDFMTHDYGTIKKGADPYCEFKLTNTGKEALIITEAHGSCGCTVPEYTKEPIKPGQTVIIKVRYDTNRIGPFEKTVTVTFTGIEVAAVLHIKGTVEAPPSETPFPGPGTAPSTNGTPVNN